MSVGMPVTVTVGRRQIAVLRGILVSKPIQGRPRMVASTKGRTAPLAAWAWLAAATMAVAALAPPGACAFRIAPVSFAEASTVVAAPAVPDAFACRVALALHAVVWIVVAAPAPRAAFVPRAAASSTVAPRTAVAEPVRAAANIRTAWRSKGDPIGRQGATW